jgi:hypothetical protein
MSLDPQVLRVGAAYESARADARSAAIELRRRRRVDLGDLISIVFESRETLTAAAEEALRSARIEDPETVAAEAGRFGLLLPAPGGLAATLFLEISDAAELASVRSELEGVAEGVQLEIDGSRAPATVFPVSVAGDGAAPVARLGFELTPSQREAWVEGARVLLRSTHPRYSVSTELSDEQRATLAADLTPAAAGERG